LPALFLVQGEIMAKAMRSATIPVWRLVVPACAFVRRADLVMLIIIVSLV
jgi:hypothetical protein